MASEVNGTWQKARPVPGIAALTPHSTDDEVHSVSRTRSGYCVAAGDAGLYAVSCPAAGNCTAGGGYTDSGDYGQAFMLSEHDGTWSDAQQVPGVPVAPRNAAETFTSVSCTGPGDAAPAGPTTAPRDSRPS